MGRSIEFLADGRKSHGYLAHPQGHAIAPNGKGVLVLQEWWGLVPHILDVTERFARLGYVALAPDFWAGTRTSMPDEAERLFMALDVDRATVELRGAVAALHAHGAHGKLGVVGFCMGGALALHAATALPDEIGACVDFYGAHPNLTPDFTRLRAPVLGIFGARDLSVPPQTAHALKSTVEAAGVACELHLYDADHAFFNDTRPEVYEPAAAMDAWQKTVDFLRRVL